MIRPVSGSTCACAECGSMAACEIDGTVYVSSNTMSDSVNPVSTSPVRSLKCSRTFGISPGETKSTLR